MATKHSSESSPHLRPVHDRFRPGTRVRAKDPTGVLGPVDVNSVHDALNM
jgi:hypothetical protein